MATEAGLGIGGKQASSDEVGISAFDLFQSIDIDNSIQNSTLISVRPTASTTATGAGPYDFHITPGSINIYYIFFL